MLHYVPRTEKYKFFLFMQVYWFMFGIACICVFIYIGDAFYFMRWQLVTPVSTALIVQTAYKFRPNSIAYTHICSYYWYIICMHWRTEMCVYCVSKMGIVLV